MSETDANAGTDIAAEVQIAENAAVEAATKIATQLEATDDVKVESKTEEKVADVQDKRFAAKFAALNRREKQIKQRERAAEQRLAQIEAQLAAANKPKEEPKAEEVPLKTRFMKDPFNTLKELGLPYEALTKMALEGGQLPPEIQMELREQELERRFEEKYGTKITAYEKQIEAERAATEARQMQEAVVSFKTEISQIVEANKESLEVLAAEGAEGIDLVYDVMDAHYNETGKILDKKEAAELVEAELLAELEKRLTLNKVQKKVGAQTPASKQQTGKKPSPTLTNASQQVSQGSARFKSDEESRREAAKLIKWTEE